jgi:hypothetical protein
VETLDAYRIEPNASQPVPCRTPSRVRRIGDVRLPLAGPYRPRARLYLYPDGRLLWYVRLWDTDRAVPHLVRTSTLVGFARANGLRATLAEVERLDARGRAEARRALP